MNSITNQRAALDLSRASPECIFLVIWFKIKRHNTVYISRSQKCWCTHARVHLISISSIVPAVCARSMRDLMPVAEMKECSCLPSRLKSLIKLSSWRTFAYVPTQSYKKRSYRPLPSSKNPHFQNEAKCITFLVKMSVIGINHFHIKG